MFYSALKIPILKITCEALRFSGEDPCTSPYVNPFLFLGGIAPVNILFSMKNPDFEYYELGPENGRGESLHKPVRFLSFFLCEMSRFILYSALKIPILNLTS